MNSLKSVVRISAIIVLGGMYHASAVAATANGTAAATLITPLEVSEDATQKLNFGIVAAAPAGGGNTTVSLTDVATTARSVIGNGQLIAGGTVASGKMNIIGEAGKLVNIAVVDGSADLSDGAPTPTTLVFTPTATTTSLTLPGVSGSATASFYVGGDLVIPEAAPAGTYTSSTAYQVTVNYN